MANRFGKVYWKRTALLAAALVLAVSFSACKRGGDAPQESSGLASVSAHDPNVFPEGASIGGKNVGGKTVEEALPIARAALEETMGAMEISVKFKDDTVALRGEDFTTQDILELALPEMLESGKADKFELPFVADLSQAGKQKLQEAAKACFAQGKDATVSGFNTESQAFEFTDEQAGSRVDMAATLQSIRQQLAQKRGGAIQAAFVEAQPKVTKKYLQEHFKLLSTYSTESTNTANGNSNMSLALSHVNKTILNPGDLFSYNTATGDSTNPANGWLPAGGLAGGLSVEMYGGGICQGSTTLYNAALMAGMEIVERDCHSSPSSYCPIGLDATVDYGNIDFQFRNSLKNPVYIAAWMDGVTLTVNFYGCFPEEWDNIELGSEQTGYEPPRESVEFRVDGSLAKGQYVRKTSGNSGYYASAWRTFYKNGEAVRTESLPDSYYGSTGKIYLVGEGTDTSKVDTSKESGTTDPKPTPTPAPSATPKPTSAPPVPDPTPEPDPEPDPDPTPEPEPDPEPTPDPFDPDVPDPTEDPDEGGDAGLESSLWE
ncbi:VanW family protein [Acutalibacter sp.]|uniref:VanW family protein n=1 Tax=Acutalibacter sp. TaxID=1918636 RepID=UPI00216F23F6|nr:VanW family protein [Acutalibacter sp.]